MNISFSVLTTMCFVMYIYLVMTIQSSSFYMSLVCTSVDDHQGGKIGGVSFAVLLERATARQAHPILEFRNRTSNVDI
jgi:membrane associated rhomboid family serine protease